MASTIVTRTISAVQENAIQMSNSSWARPISIPSTWSKIRVGIRFHFTPAVSPGSGTNFVLGLGSGTTQIIGDFTTTNFVGVSSNGSFSIGGGVFQNYANTAVKKVGTLYTVGTNLDNNNIKFFPVAAAATADRVLWFIDITKGSPNYTLNCFGSNSNGDQSAATFLTQVQAAVPSLPTYSTASSGAQTIAFDETAGTLNAVQCWWNTTASLAEICDLAVVLLA